MKKKGILVVFLLLLLLSPIIALLIPVEAQEAESTPSTVSEIWGNPIIFEEFSSYIRLNFTMFVVDFYKGTAGYNVLYDTDGDIVVHEERQALQYWTGNQWKQRGVPVDLSWVKVSEYQYNVTRHYQDWADTFYSVTFVVKSDSKLKSIISIDSGQTDEYRLLWQMSGIVYEDWNKADNRLTFGLGDIDYEWIAFDWEDVYQSLGDITNYTVETAAQGKKASIYFNIGEVAIGAHVEIDPATVATSIELFFPFTVTYGYMRKGFYAEGLFWAFYNNGTDAGWEFSADGTTWTGAFTSIGACTLGYQFSIWFDGTYIHYARYKTYDLFYRRGTPENDGSITWSAVEQTVYDGASGDKYDYPNIVVDTNGYAWIGAGNDQPDGDDFPVVLKNDENDGTWVTEFAYELSAIDDTTWRIAPVPLTDGKMYVIYCRPAQAPLGKLYDAGWGSEESGLADYAFQAGTQFSAVALSDNVHFVYNRRTTNQIRHNKRVYGVGWDAADVLVEGTLVGSDTGPTLSADPSTSDLYCFWTNTTTDHVYYKQWDDEWDAVPTDWIDETTDDIPLDYLHSSFYMDYGYRIGLLYLTKLEEPYNLRFAFLTMPFTPTITSAEITDMDTTDNCYEMKQYYTFRVIVTDPQGADTIANVSLRIMNEAVRLTEFNATTLDGVPAYSISFADNIVDLDDGSCSWGEVGDVGTLILKIRFEWDFVDIANLELSVYVMDEDGNDAGWTEISSDYFDVIGRLVTINFAANATYVGKGEGVELTGSVRYATTVDGDDPSDEYPPNAQFTSVDIHDAGHVERGTDGTIVNGAFSVEFTIPDAVQTNTYHVYLDLVADYTDADAPDGDTIIVYGMGSTLLFSFDEEVSLTITNDTSGSGNDGTISGANRTGVGKFGKAMAFDGLNDYINVTDDNSLDITVNITMSTWILTSDPNTQVILEKKGAYRLSIEPSFGIRVTINTTHVDTAINIFDAGNWTYVSGVYNGSYVNIYIDAVLVKSQVMTGSIAATATHLYVGNQTNSFNGTIDEVRIYNQVVTQPNLAAHMVAPLATFPYNLQGSITDMEADDWVFAGDAYPFVCAYVTENVTTYPFDTLGIAFYDGVSWTYGYYDDVDDTWEMTSGVAYMVEVTDSYDGNEITVTFTIYIRDTIFDAYDVDLYMYCNVTTADEDDWEPVEEDYFNIYNHGGETETDYGGDGGSVVGGGIFDVGAQNSTTGSYAAANVTWRKFQHLRLVTHLWSNTTWDVAGEHWNCPDEHANTGYVEYLLYYYANNTMMEGWKVRLEIVDGKAGTYGAGMDQAWVKLNATWYNRGVYVKHDEFYTYYEAHTATDNNTQFALCLDLWIGIEDASSVVGGRVSAEYYGMRKTGWLFWTEWSPMKHEKEISTFSDDLLSSDPAYVISARSVSLFKVGVIINKTSADAGDPDCDEHLWALIDTDIDWRYLGPDEAMVGIDSPIPMETVSPFDPKTGYLSSLVTALVAGITVPIVRAIMSTAGALLFLVKEVINLAFRQVGIIDFVEIMLTDPDSYTKVIARSFATSVTSVVLLIVQIFRIIAGVSTFLITWFTRMITVFLDMWRIAGEVWSGTNSLLGGMGSLWDLFFTGGALISAIPIFIAIGWFDSIDKRAKRVGGGWLGFFIGDLQMVSWVLSFLVEWMFRVINTAMNMVFRLMDILRV